MPVVPGPLGGVGVISAFMVVYGWYERLFAEAEAH